MRCRTQCWRPGSSSSASAIPGRGTRRAARRGPAFHRRVPPSASASQPRSQRLLLLLHGAPSLLLPRRPVPWPHCTARTAPLPPAQARPPISVSSRPAIAARKPRPTSRGALSYRSRAPRQCRFGSERAGAPRGTPPATPSGRAAPASSRSPFFLAPKNGRTGRTWSRTWSCTDLELETELRAFPSIRVPIAPLSPSGARP